jgi:hypothetical protein
MNEGLLQREISRINCIWGNSQSHRIEATVGCFLNTLAAAIPNPGMMLKMRKTF